MIRLSKNTFLEPKTNPKLLLPKSPENCPKIIMFGHDFSGAVEIRFTWRTPRAFRRAAFRFLCRFLSFEFAFQPSRCPYSRIRAYTLPLPRIYMFSLFPFTKRPYLPVPLQVA